MALGYKCNAKDTLAIQGEVKMDLTDVQYRAFGDTDTDDFPDGCK